MSNVMSRKSKKMTTLPEEEDSLLTDELIDDAEGEVADSSELTDIPIEQFLNDPKMAELSDDGEDEEFTAWCPVCNDHTIFADNTCTVCGFEKGGKKNIDKHESEEGTGNAFDLMPTDEFEDMNEHNGFDEEETTY